MGTMTTPDRTEAAEYYFTYIDQVGPGDICEILERQANETDAFLRGISNERSLYRYAPDKWSIRQAVGHMNDAERVFLFRAFWFARGFEDPLSSFDQTIATDQKGRESCSTKPMCARYDEAIKAMKSRKVEHEARLAKFKSDAAEACKSS